MAYHFQINGETFIGRTLPGASRVRIFRCETEQFLVAFDPDIPSLRSKHPCGSWSHIQPGVEVSLLETLQPQILSACQAHLRQSGRASHS
jgi:hypothetical protein